MPKVKSLKAAHAFALWIVTFQFILSFTHAEQTKSAEAPDWAAEYIQELLDSGSITGFDEDGDGKPDDFKPQEEIRRAEFVTVLAKALKMEPDSEGDSPFKDVAQKHWALGFILAVKNKNLLPPEMLAGGAFKPSQPLTREEIAAILVNTMGRQNDVANLSLTDLKKHALKDTPMDAWSTPYIIVAMKNGIVKGYDDKTFKPQKTVIRVEAFAMVVRTLQQIPQDVLMGLGLIEKEGLYTGVIVDCRGINIKAAMAPKLLDENGNTVYGEVEITEYLETVGIMGYSKSEEEAMPRVGKNPLIVRAIDARGQGEVLINPVISNEDAQKIIEENKKAKFLEKYRIVILKD